MNGHLRLLNIACAAKAKWRQVVLQKASRESPLHFSLSGGSEKGFGIFVEGVEPSSKAADAGLKRGDQVSKISNHLDESLISNISATFFLIWHFFQVSMINLRKYFFEPFFRGSIWKWFISKLYLLYIHYF